MAQTHDFSIRSTQANRFAMRQLGKTPSNVAEAAKDSASPSGSYESTTGVTVQRLQCFKTKRCRFWMEGRCTRGESCTYAHTDVELRSPPDLTKTKICSRWKRNNCDKTPNQCAYAHGPDDLRDTATPSTSASTKRRARSPATSSDLDLDELDELDKGSESMTHDPSSPSFGITTGAEEEEDDDNEDDSQDDTDDISEPAFPLSRDEPDFQSALSDLNDTIGEDILPSRRVGLLSFRSPMSEHGSEFGDATPIGRNAAVLPLPPANSTWLASATVEDLARVASVRHLPLGLPTRLMRSDTMSSELSCESDCSRIRPTISHVFQVTSEAYFD